MPGTEAKDAYLPVGQFSASWSLNEDPALLGFYQYEWEETQLNPVGDYFNGSDIFGPGAEYFRFAAGNPQFTALSYAGEEKPRDSGQWGLGLRYRLTDSTELGLFHYRYHERVGALFFNFGGDTRYSSLSGNVARHLQAGLLRGRETDRGEFQLEDRRRGAVRRRPQLSRRLGGLPGQRHAGTR